MHLVEVGIRSTVGSVSSERIRLWELFELKKVWGFLTRCWDARTLAYFWIGETFSV